MGRCVLQLSLHCDTCTPIQQENKYSEGYQGKNYRLEVFPVELGEFDHTFAISMWFFRLLKRRLNMPIITEMFLWIAIICCIHIIDPLKSTKIFVVGRLKKLSQEDGIDGGNFI